MGQPDPAYWPYAAVPAPLGPGSEKSFEHIMNLYTL
jgi:hypothetical protein